MRAHLLDPIVTGRSAIGIGQQDPIESSRADTQRKRIFLSRNVLRQAVYVHHPKAMILFRLTQQPIKCVIIRAVVNDDHLKCGIILTQQDRYKLAEVMKFVVCTYDDRHRGPFAMLPGRLSPGKRHQKKHREHDLYTHNSGEDYE
jgi:hypothetical protein